MNIRKKFGSTVATAVIVVLSTPTFGYSDATPTAQSGQVDKYQAAAKLCSGAKSADEISMGLWGAVAALCGYNCFNYFTLRTERAAITSSATAADAAAKVALGCPAAAANAALVDGQVAAITTTITQAETETVKAAAAQAAPMAGGATGTGPATAHETLVTQTNTLGGTIITTGTECAAGAVTPCATSWIGGATAAACTACTTCASTLPTAGSTLITNANALLAHMTPIISTGKICAYGSFAAAIGDVTLAATLAKDVTKGLMGLAGAAPGLYTLLTANQTDTIASTVSAEGKSSCFTAGLSLVLAAIKAMSMQKDSSCEKKNQDLANALSSNAATAPAAGVAGGTPAAGSGVSAGVADVGHSVTSASSTDPAIANVEGLSPGKFGEVFGAATEALGSSPEDFLGKGKFSIDSLPEMMTRPNPAAAGDMANLLNEVKAEVAKDFPDGIKVVAKDNPVNTAYTGGGGGGAKSAALDGMGGFGFSGGGAAAMGKADQMVFGAKSPKSNEPDSNDIWHTGYKGSIFQIISTRIKKTPDPIEKLDWVAPFNRFQHGLPLSAPKNKANTK